MGNSSDTPQAPVRSSVREPAGRPNCYENGAFALRYGKNVLRRPPKTCIISSDVNPAGGAGLFPGVPAVIIHAARRAERKERRSEDPFGQITPGFVSAPHPQT